MSVPVIKLTGNTFTANQTANVVPLPSGQGNSTVGASTLYIYNSNVTTGSVTITVANSGGNIGSIVVGPNQTVILAKQPGDTIFATPNTAVVPIAKYY